MDLILTKYFKKVNMKVGVVLLSIYFNLAGISYLSRAEETSYQDLLAEARKARSNPSQSLFSPKPVQSADREIVDLIL